MERFRFDLARQANKKPYVIMAALALAKEPRLAERLAKLLEVDRRSSALPDLAGWAHGPWTSLFEVGSPPPAASRGPFSPLLPYPVVDAPKLVAHDRVPTLQKSQSDTARLIAFFLVLPAPARLARPRGAASSPPRPPAELVKRRAFVTSVSGTGNLFTWPGSSGADRHRSCADSVCLGAGERRRVAQRQHLPEPGSRPPRSTPTATSRAFPGRRAAAVTARSCRAAGPGISPTASPASPARSTS